MIAPDQREVSVKKAGSVLPRRTLAILLSFALIQPAFAQDAGVSDAPLAVRIESGLLLNPAAEKKLDDELKRLQGVERSHKAESWLTTVLVAVGVGLVVGAAAGASVALVAAPKKP